MNNIIFIGGIHGSGKGRICEEIVLNHKILHLTASEVLKWNEISNPTSKLVANIKDTQNRLINNLKEIIKEDETYLLDGHYCLLNSVFVPEKIPLQTFLNINPYKFILVISDPIEVKKRLEARDKKIYNLSLIKKFQNFETQYAYEISKMLSKPILVVDSMNYEITNLLNFIK